MLAAVFVAEIGDIGRSSKPEQVASWGGLTPTHHESDTTVHRGRITSSFPNSACSSSMPPARAAACRRPLLLRQELS